MLPGVKMSFSECVHDFFAFNQFGTTIYNIMLKLSADDPACRAWFRKTMHGDGVQADGSASYRLRAARTWSCSAPIRPMPAASRASRRSERGTRTGRYSC